MGDEPNQPSVAFVEESYAKPDIQIAQETAAATPGSKPLPPGWTRIPPPYHAPLQLGVEVECLLIPHDQTFYAEQTEKFKIMDKPSKPRQIFARDVVRNHNFTVDKDEDFSMESFCSVYGSEETYEPGTEGDTTLWGIIPEHSIIEESWSHPIDSNAAVMFGLEIVSPVLAFDSTGKWRYHIRKMFENVDKIATFITNRSCSTHVHMSPGVPEPGGIGPDWTFEELSRIACCIIYFEPAFQVLLPESRRKNTWCETNGANAIVLKPLTTEHC